MTLKYTMRKSRLSLDASAQQCMCSFPALYNPPQSHTDPVSFLIHSYTVHI